jgi:hypothetical protein
MHTMLHTIETNLESHIISKVATCKIWLILNYFEDHIQMIWALKIKEVTRIMKMKLKNSYIYIYIYIDTHTNSLIKVF